MEPLTGLGDLPLAPEQPIEKQQGDQVTTGQCWWCSAAAGAMLGAAQACSGGSSLCGGLDLEPGDPLQWHSQAQGLLVLTSPWRAQAPLGCKGMRPGHPETPPGHYLKPSFLQVSS